MTYLEQLVNETINKLSNKGIILNEEQLQELSDDYKIKIPVTEELLENFIVTDYTFSSFYHPEELNKELLSSYLTITPDDISLNTDKLFNHVTDEEVPYLNEDLAKINDELQNVLFTFNYTIEQFLNKKLFAIEKDNLGKTELRKKDLQYLNDNIDDKFKIDFEISVGTRNQAFVYLDGKVAVGNDHSELTKELLQDDYDAGRIDSYDLDVPIAFGHIINNFAFIEFAQNATKQEVAENIINNEQIEKVYDYSNTHKIITRLAKSIYNSN